MSTEIRTFTRALVDPLDLSPQDVRLEDIAHALALQCRWNGHSAGHLSVARHSLWVAYRCPEELRLAGLLHDAAEAYLGDLVAPLKHGSALGDEYLQVEERVEKAIAERFGLPFPLPAEVKEADRSVTESERTYERQTWFGRWQDDKREFLAWAKHYGAQ